MLTKMTCRKAVEKTGSGADQTTSWLSAQLPGESFYKMKLFIRTMLLQHIIRNAITVSAVVGTFLNIINQGPTVIAGEEISWAKFLINYLVPYCVSSYSAAKNELNNNC